MTTSTININITQICEAIRSNNAETKKPAQEAIIIEGTNNYYNLIAELSNYLCMENQSEGNRQLCGILLKNLINGDNGIYSAFRGKWLNLPKEQNSLIKKFIFATLGASSKLVRSSASLCISAICSLEFPLGEWFEILVNLDAAARGSNQTFREASILTIKNIMQDVEVDVINGNNLGLILFSIMSNLSPETPSEIRKEALSALLYTLASCKEYMVINEKREKIMGLIYSALSTNEEERLLGLQCLIEVAKYFYNEVEAHLQEISGLMKNYIMGIKKLKDVEDRVITIFFQFWNIIAETEVVYHSKKFPVKDYSVKYINDLLFFCITLLEKRGVEEDKDEFLPHRSIEELLIKLNKIPTLDIIDSLMQYAGTFLSNNQIPRAKQSGMLIILSTISSCHILKVNKMINDNLKNILEKMEDNDLEVQILTSVILYKICKFHSDKMSNDQQNFILNYLLSKVSNIKSINKEIAVNINKALNEFCKLIPLKMNSSKYSLNFYS